LSRDFYLLTTAKTVGDSQLHFVAHLLKKMLTTHYRSALIKLINERSKVAVYDQQSLCQKFATRYERFTVLITGDYKLESDATCKAGEPVPYHTMITESIFVLPM